MLSRAACGLAIRWISRAAIGLLSELLDPPRIVESRPSDIFASQTTINKANWQILFASFRFVFVIPGKVQSDVLEILYL